LSGQNRLRRNTPETGLSNTGLKLGSESKAEDCNTTETPPRPTGCTTHAHSSILCKIRTQQGTFPTARKEPHIDQGCNQQEGLCKSHILEPHLLQGVGCVCMHREFPPVKGFHCLLSQSAQRLNSTSKRLPLPPEPVGSSRARALVPPNCCWMYYRAMLFHLVFE